VSGPRRALVGRVIADARTRTLSFAALFFGVIWANAAGYKSTYPHEADRIKLVATFADNKAARMFYGAGHALTTVGGYTAWRAGGLLVIFAGLFGVFAAAKPMRGDEESGRSELVLAGALTRTGAFGAAITAIFVTLFALFVATALGAVAGGLAFTGSLFLGLTVTSVAVVYTAIGAVANQIMPTRRSALGVAGAILGVDFLLRVVADTTDTVGLHWFTPLGWAEELRAFSGSRPIVFLLPAVLTLVLLVAAAMLRNRRDLGAAYVAPHDTADAHLASLASPFRLAARLDRFTIATWTGAVAAFALVVGTVAKSVEDLDLPQSLRDQLEQLGVDITRAKGYVGFTFIMFVFAIALFVCGQLGAARDDESSHRLETLFALPYGRTRWLQGRVALVLGGTIACALVAGAGTGLGVFLTGGHMTFLEGMAGGLNVLPAEVLFLGVGVLLLALTPRHGVGLLYAFVVVAFVWELFGALLKFPHWILDLSPFHHVAPTPAKPVEIAAALVMLAIGALAAVVGARRFRQRDLAGD
jgi:ABC-2 type transport system permease protein